MLSDEASLPVEWMSSEGGAVGESCLAAAVRVVLLFIVSTPRSSIADRGRQLT